MQMSVLTAKGAQTPFGVAPRIKSYTGGRASSRSACRSSIRASSTCRWPKLRPISARKVRRPSIEVFVDDADHMDAVRLQLDKAIDRPAVMTDWRQRNKTFFDALNVERNVMFIILTLIVLVAALNIVSGLIMLVKDKSSDIAILRTMGASRGSILRIFLIAGASIGTCGTFAGLLLGVAVARNIEGIRSFPEQRDAHQPVSDPSSTSCRSSLRLSSRAMSSP